MTITKKAFIGILSLTAAVLLAACSGNTNQGGNTSSSQNTQGSHQPHLPLISLLHHQMQGRLLI